MNLFSQHFENKATLDRATYATDAQGQEEKTFAPLYENIDANLIRNVRSGQRRHITGQDEKTVVQWRLDVDAQYSGGARGDRVTIWPAASNPSEGRKFQVVDTEKKLDIWGRVAFYYYFLEEIE